MTKKELKVVEALNSRTRNEKEIKTINSERTIKLESEILELLSQNKLSTCVDENDFVFKSADNKPLRHQVLFKARNRVLKKAKFDNIRIHDLRHGAGTILLDKGYPVIYVAGFLGQTPATTMGVYSHTSRVGDSSKILE